MAMTDGEEGACALVIGSNGERKRHRGGGGGMHTCSAACGKGVRAKGGMRTCDGCNDGAEQVNRGRT
jgi:hypothetical protein